MGGGRAAEKAKDDDENERASVLAGAVYAGGGIPAEEQRGIVNALRRKYNILSALGHAISGCAR